MDIETAERVRRASLPLSPQAWAIVYECAKCLDMCLANAATAASPSLAALTDARQLFLHKESAMIQRCLSRDTTQMLWSSVHGMHHVGNNISCYCAHDTHRLWLDWK